MSTPGMKSSTFIIAALLFIAAACNIGTDKKILLNQGASFTSADTLTENPLTEKVLTVSVNPTDSTMSTLYANAIAWNYASKNNDIKYPSGAVLYQVTWKQKPDPVWFGANIPKEIQSVERISYTYNGPNYELYEGHPLRKVNSMHDTKKIESVVVQKMAVSP
jgi:hypothetical protein